MHLSEKLYKLYKPLTKVVNKKPYIIISVVLVKFIQQVHHIPLVLSSSAVMNFSCPSGLMRKERIRVGSRSSLPDVAIICI